MQKRQIILYFCALCWSCCGGQECQVELTYEAAIANSTAQDDQKTKFIGRFAVHNNLNDTAINSWRLVFQFTDEERIQDQRDILTSNISLMAGSLQEDIVLEWEARNTQPVRKGTSQMFRFLGQKDVTESTATVASIANIKFSNLECFEDPGLIIPRSGEVEEIDPENAQVDIFYKSIESIEDEEIRIHQYQVFYIDIVSRKNQTINLKDLVLYYYFEGGNSGSVLKNSDFDPQCVDAKPMPCANLSLVVEEGLKGMREAQNLLKIGFQENTGYLLGEEYASERPLSFIVEQTGESAYSRLSLIIAIQTKSPYNFLNVSRDYSFIEAPLLGLLNVSEADQVTQRSEIRNNKIPTYLNGELVAGVTPYAALQKLGDSQQGLDGGVDNSTDPAVCVVRQANESQVCSLIVRYCCNGDNKLVGDYLAPIFPPPYLPPPPPILATVEKSVPATSRGPADLTIEESYSQEGGGSDDDLLMWIIITVAVSIILLGILCMYIIYSRLCKAQKKQVGRGGESMLRLKQPGSQMDLMNSTGIGAFQLSERDLYDEMTVGPMGYFSRIIGFQPDMNTLQGPGDSFSQTQQNGVVVRDETKGGGKVVEDEPLLMGHRRWQTMPSLPSTEWSSFTAKFLAENSMPEDTAMGNDIHSGKTWNEIFDSDWELSEVPKMLQDRIDAGLSYALLPPQSLPAPVTCSSPMSAEIDLNVNFTTEIQPYLGRVLGSGGFGKVYEAEWKGQKVAVKVINEGVFKEGSDAYEALRAEVEMSCKISGQCERVVKILGASLKDFDNMCIIMELVEGGSLADRIYNRNKRKLSYLEILQIAHDISCALAYLHPTIIHRDLKPQNILMDTKGRAKIADFGISRFKDPDATHLSVTQPNGTPSYMAPEMFNGTKVDEKCDVYSVGVILWECLTRKKPWQEHSRFAQIIMSVAIMGERLKVPDDAPPVLKRLIERCWDADPCRRPSTQEIMRNTEVYIQQELHSIQTRNPMKARMTGSSSSFIQDRKNINSRDSWSSKLASMRSDVDNAVTKFETLVGHQINCQGPSVEDIVMINDGNDTGGSLAHHISLPSDFDANLRNSHLLKQGSDPLQSLQESPFRQASHEGEVDSGQARQRVSQKTSLSTINSKSNSKSSGIQSDHSLNSQEAGGTGLRTRKLSEENLYHRNSGGRSTSRQGSFGSRRSRELSTYMSANDNSLSSGDLSQYQR